MHIASHDTAFGWAGRVARVPRHYGRVSLFWLALACFAAPPVQAADASRQADAPVLILQKIQVAARELDYSGVFTYQQGSSLQSTRIVHIVDGTGERERLEMLDGEPREFLRHNDSVQCLVPDKKLIIMESRRGDRFPGLLIGDGKNIPAYYSVKRAKSLSRIAGRECAMIELIPKDSYRYGYRFCADTKTNLLLKAQILGKQSNIIDQISFSSVLAGEKVSAEQLATSWNTQGWRVLEVPVQLTDLTKSGWRIPAPPGFETISQVSLPMKSGKQVSQLVLSDGLAAISVFIEPFEQSDDQTLPKGAARKGAMSIYGTRIGDHWMTVIGEVPAATLRDIADRTEYVPLTSTK